MRYLADARAQSAESTPDGARRWVLSYGANLMAVELTFDAGTKPEPHPHSHPHEQIGYVVSGSLELLMEGQETAALGAGCSYYVPSGATHSIRSLEPTVLLDSFTPAREDFVD